MNFSLRNSRLLDIISQVYVDDPRKHGRRWQILLVLFSPLSLLLLYWAFMNATVNALPVFDKLPASSGVLAAAGEGAWLGQKDWIKLRVQNETVRFRASLSDEQLAKARGGIGQSATVRWAEQYPPFFPVPYKRMFHLVSRQDIVLDYAGEVQAEQSRRSFFVVLEGLCIIHLLSALLVPWAPMLRYSILYKVYVEESLRRSPRRAKIAWGLGTLSFLLLLQALPSMALPDQMDESKIRTINGKLADFHKSGMLLSNIAFTVLSDRENATFSIKSTLPSAERLVGTLSSHEMVEVKWYPGYRDGLWSNNLPVSISIGGKEASSLAWGKFAYQSSVKTNKRYGYLAILALLYLAAAPWWYHMVLTLREAGAE